MGHLRENAITLLESTAGVNLNGVAGTETGLFTVPAGKTALVTQSIP
jgi:hypothetical protein